MEKNELLKLWEDKYHDGEILHDVLAAVYDVGFEAGKDAQKLEVQLSKLGTPTHIHD